MMDFVEKLVTAHEKVPHRAHQLVGIEQLVKDKDLERTAVHNGVTYRREVPGVFALLDEVGAGKSKQIVDTSQVLWGWQQLDTMVVFTPGYARSTWAEEDPALGEVAKHAWDGVPNIIHEYHGGYTDLDLRYNGLHWIVSNYEFIRRDPRRDHLIKLLKGRRVWLVLDESWAIKGNSDQMRACRMIRRKRAERVTILNGTPLADGKPSDLYYQFEMLDPSIIGCENRTHFKSKHCVMGGEDGTRVVDYQNLDELNARIAPYVLSRRTRDCFDLPPMLPPIIIEARLNDSLWRTYKQMRDDMVAWCGNQVSVSQQAITKALRLAQLTSGFLGGLEDAPQQQSELGLPATKFVQQTSAPVPPWLRQIGGLPFEDPKVHQEASASGTPATGGQDGGQGAGPQGPGSPAAVPRVTKELGREKLDAFLHWLRTLGAQPDKLVAWCRFTPELERAGAALRDIYPEVMFLRGGQGKEARRQTKAALAPGSKGRAAVVGNPGAGGASLNFSAANIMVFLSNDVALIKRTQAIGRIERPGATQPMLIVDVIATGPKGQKTIDHQILKSLRNKDDMARWTVQQWRDAIKEE